MVIHFGFIVLCFFISLTSITQSQCFISSNISCPATPAQSCTGAQIIYLEEVKYTCSTPLNISGSSLVIKNSMIYSIINVNAVFVNISGTNLFNGLNINYSRSVSMIGTTVTVGMLYINYTQVGPSILFNYTINITSMILNVGQIVLESDVTTITQSSISSEVIVMQSSYQINILGSTLVTAINQCFVKPLLNQNVTLLIRENISFGPTFLSYGIDIILKSYSQLTISSGTLLNASVVVIISMQNLDIVESIINTTARGCRANFGPGRGMSVQLGIGNHCMQGGSSAGYGVSSSLSCQSILQYFTFLTHSFPYIGLQAFISTGSGGFGYMTSGLGGGSIFAYGFNQLTLNQSKLLSNGGNSPVLEVGSAGSAGTIYLSTGTFIGNMTNISACGGNSFNNNGSGAGGVVRIFFTNQSLVSRTVWVNVSQGYQANIGSNLNLYSNGLFYGPICPSGSEVFFFKCVLCIPGYYSVIGDQICRPCPNNNNLIIDKKAVGNSDIQSCYQNSTAMLQFWFHPGNVNLYYILVYIGCLLICVLIAVIITRKLSRKKSILESQQFNFQDAVRELTGNKIITQSLKKDSAFNLADIVYHIHRITLNGANSVSCPWMLPSSPPQQIQEYVLKQAYGDFSEKLNNLVKWSKKQRYIGRLLMLIYPLYWLYYVRCKKEKYQNIVKLVEEMNEFNFINNYDYQDSELVLFKISKNADYTLCYIDFFTYERSNLKYFKLTEPFIIYLSGQGSFLKPFYLCEQDIFLNALFFIISRNIQKQEEEEPDERQKLFGNLVGEKKRKENSFYLVQFIKKFNTLSLTVDIGASKQNFICSLIRLILFVDQWNNFLFNKCLVHIDLLLIITEYSYKKVNKSTIRILAHSDPNKITEFVEEILYRKKKSTFCDVKFGLFVYNPEQQFLNELEKQKIQVSDQDFDKMDDIDDEEVKDRLLSQGSLALAIKPKGSQILTKLARFRELLSYLMLSHRFSKLDKYLLKFITSVFIVFQALFVMIWSLKLEVPYILVNIISPFVGVIWFVSDSYGVGKLFVILNLMSLFDQIVSLAIYLAIQPNDIIRIVICQCINILVGFIVAFLNVRNITNSKKINTPLMFK